MTDRRPGDADGAADADHTGNADNAVGTVTDGAATDETAASRSTAAENEATRTSAEDDAARTTAAEERVVTWVLLLLGLSVVAAVGLAVAWVVEAGVAVQGLLLGTSLLALGAALGLWANRLTHDREEIEPRPSLAPTADKELAADEIGPPAYVARRGLLVRAAVVAGGALGAAAVLPLRAMGPNPGKELLRTGWNAGRRLVTADGDEVRADDIPLDSLLTAFPHESAAADGQIVVVRVRADLLELPPERLNWAPSGLVAYSKVCTHAGCPVGLYNAETKQLLCPCHQSAFDVLRGAEPRGGPAAWPLPQLPLAIDDDGTLLAAGPLSEPVGTGWWREG